MTQIASLCGYPDYSQMTDIKSYQSAENAFECPSNGYIIITRGIIISGTPAYCINNNTVLVITTNSTENIGGTLFPVKKGDLFYSTGFDYNYSRINFIPNK